MITAEDVGGVHIKYLHHCPRQLWLFARGIRPERLSALVQLGEAVDETTFTRASPVDLGAARLDFIDGKHWVHEVKSSRRPSPADEAQVVHYCHRLDQLGVPVEGAVLHYPATRRTRRIVFDDEQRDRAQRDIARALTIVSQAQSPPKPARSRCKGCSYLDYCWTE